ncbi:helix-turn-helix transcriptional regulator [Clostridium scatologenes]|uniref:helix-turn-helix transcriptional regulator n=1 Tax=Clostridium scatologenes TaxID=1548 RepID=UPI001FA71A07|nr:PAS domain-containing protein [Clostridium scatologenes]
MEILNDRELIEKHIPIAEFISEILGDNCEVLIHDVTNPNHSVIFIKNGHLSGRRIGAPITNLVLNIIQNKSYKNKDFVANYKAEGNLKNFRSASYFIKNEKNEIVGAICINIDIEEYNNVKKLMDKLCFISNDSAKEIEDIKTQEQFYDNVDDILNTMIYDVIRDINIDPQRMSADEKIYVVKQLYDKGTFNLKGAVLEVAKALQVSEPTIYRYLNKFKSSH